MTLLFNETFSGSGSLDGKSPDVGDPGGGLWGSFPGFNGCIVEQLGGYAVNSLPADADDMAQGEISLSGYGQLADYSLSLELLTGSSLPTGWPFPIQVALVANNGGYELAMGFFLAYDAVEGWRVIISGDGLDQDVVLPVSLDVNTAYPCVLSYSAGAQVFSGFGQTVEISKAAGSPGTTTPYYFRFFLGMDTRLEGVSLLSGEAESVVQGNASAPTMLSAPAVLASADGASVATRSASPSMLQGAKALAFHDFTGQLGDSTTLFIMDLATPGGTVRIPISSWQATLQTGSSNYVQCVIPACVMWVSAINSATEFVIYRRAVLPSGASINYEMARAPAEQAQFDQGPERHTCTLSGYSTAFAASEDPPAVYDRALTGVRSISSGSSYRVRCAVDWLLRPGHRAFVENVPFIVKFINYYAPSGSDCYMDVGG